MSRILVELVAVPNTKFALVQFISQLAPPGVMAVVVGQDGAFSVKELIDLKALRWDAPNQDLFIDEAPL